MANTPNVNAPEWVASEASPWLHHNAAMRAFDAFAAYSIIEDRDLTAPPGSCADGARYLLPAAGVLGGAWLAHNGQLAIAVGVNAANGWYFATVSVEGVFIWVRDENIGIRHNGATFVAVVDSIALLSDLLDVDDTGLADGFVLKWDASNGVWYPAPDVQRIASVREILGTTYDLLNGHASDYLRFTDLGEKFVNVRLQSVHALTPDNEWHIRNAGNNNLNLNPSTGVLLNPPAGGSMVIEAGGTVTLKSVRANELDIIGQTLQLISG